MLVRFRLSRRGKRFKKKRKGQKRLVWAIEDEQQPAPSKIIDGWELLGVFKDMGRRMII